METLILQISGRAARSVEFVESNGEALSLGRAYDCDLIINDPFVSPYEVWIEKQDSSWFVVKRENENPIMLNGKRLKKDRAPIVSGDTIVLGRTHILVTDKSAPLPETKKLLMPNYLHHTSYSAVLSCLLIVFVCALDAWIDFQEVLVDYEWKKPALAAMMLSALILVWSAAWSLGGRLLRHQPHFTAQTFISALMLGVLVLLMPLPEYLEFVTNSEEVGDFASWFVYWLFLSNLLRLNFTYATHLSNPKLIGAVFSLGLLVCVYIAFNFNQASFSQQAKASMVLKPPMFKLVSSKSIDDYQVDYAELFTLARDKLPDNEELLY